MKPLEQINLRVFSCLLVRANSWLEPGQIKTSKKREDKRNPHKIILSERLQETVPLTFDIED